MFDSLRDAGFDVMVRNHAEAILSVDFPNETRELSDALLDVSIPAVELISSGGGESKGTQRLRRSLSDLGWEKHNFRIETTLDGQPLGDGTSHEIDHIRLADAGTIALEIEWNNKDPFFDRDLENFQRLHAQTIISVGVIVTRGRAMQEAMIAVVEEFLSANAIKDDFPLLEMGMKRRTDRQVRAVRSSMDRGDTFAQAFAKSFVADKFGAATTHWSKLEDRINRGVGNPCPLLLLGLPAACVKPYSAATAEL